jgi:hypothetical protein
MGDLMADPPNSHPGTTLNQFPVDAFVLRDNFGSSWSSRDHAAQLLSRALTALASAARTGRILRRADAGYFAGQLARAALLAHVEFATAARGSLRRGGRLRVCPKRTGSTRSTWMVGKSPSPRIRPPWWRYLPLTRTPPPRLTNCERLW